MNRLRKLTVFGCFLGLPLAGCTKDSEPEPEASTADRTSSSSIAVGMVVPQFEMASLDDPQLKYNRANVGGQILLIDFWATWCLPCVAELPNLHQAYDAYRDRGFEILSVALGDDREEIARLRGREWPMPWLHAFEPLDSDAAVQFDVFGVPRAVLVGADNTIIGIDEDIRGERLMETLNGVFGETN